MRVLVTAWAWPSHYLPLVPTLWALRAAGHEVLVASQPALATVVRDSGVPFVAAGPDLDHEALRRRQMRDLTHADVPPPPPPGQSAKVWTPDEWVRVSKVFSVFAARSAAMLDDLVTVARAFRPDLVLFEPTTYAGPLVAGLLGVPAVRHLHGVDLTYQAHEVVPALIAPLSERLGIDPVDPLGTHTVDICPPSMQIPARVTRTVQRYVPYNGRADTPSWLRDRPARNRICLTWGATSSSLGAPFAPPAVLDALAGTDTEVVVTLTPADRERLGPVPGNTRVVSSLALHQVLPSCAAVIHQGGFGSTLTAAALGVPQLVLPQLVDQKFQAARLAATGAGTVLTAADFSGNAVRERVGALTGEPAYARAAAGLREEIRSVPAPAETVADLHALTTGSNR
ncbi:nucleotide disphospho-sugar-binding domain-containing protein [Winogradskya humida]|uniref:Glycosyl transferase n=1 Tax=Winogradskya humida TaxID=113566 RepID=A0ABQ3ZGY6_9ACTN|nr:nucleotide disphospho-sugar-binding domain-containing protein [Actinoplanes humidus]GIE17831.1 glycosyl transferase [Actinoplanes humidus]